MQSAGGGIQILKVLIYIIYTSMDKMILFVI